MARLDPALPVFRLRRGASSVCYAPGHVAPAGPEGLKEHAEQAVARWRARLAAPFAPECLTIYLSHRCNLACPYCFWAARRAEPTVIDERAALAAARLVARSAASQGKLFHLVLHGGGEPTLHWELVERLVEGTRRIAAEAGADWSGFIATNGVLTDERARWLAEQLDVVELSCDGPPEIQDRQRPLAGGGASSAQVERTAHLVGRRLAVRTTITPETVERQAEIVAYLQERLGAKQLRFEPVYHVREPQRPAFRPEQADWFVEHFLAAQAEARRRGCDLTLAGARLDELHGPYCNVLRDTLHLLPDGTATACFFGSEPVGRFDEAAGEFVLDAERIAEHRQRTGEIPAGCEECFNQYHCARGCPEYCGLGAASAAGSFRCLVERRLAEEWIFAAAAQLLAEHGPRPRAVLQGRYRMDRCALPLPVWAERGYEHSGREAWNTLVRELAGPCERPVSMYVHVPFCDRRCGFCDCYSMPLPRGGGQEDEFARALEREIEAWGAAPALAERPLTTVHFGGGTPNCLSTPVLARILEAIRGRLRVAAGTEWALESTTSLLSQEHLEQLRAWGFTRLHVGIQTLEDGVRRLIGRREPAEAALEKLARALGMGFVVSVDIVFGLPRQTLEGLLGSLERLVAAGVHGFSLYGLNVSNRNRRFLEHHREPGRGPAWEYALFQACDQYLTGQGYRKNHFTHYAQAEDRNLYYTHLVRGEDLLALGPTADGVFGSYHYRHAEYADYLATDGCCGLEGGVRETALERRLRPAVAALMAGGIEAAMLRELGAERLLGEWLDCELLQEEGARLVLTARGSWFVSEMLRELREVVAQAITTTS